MSRKQQYNLVFSKLTVQGYFDSFLCTQVGESAEAHALSNLLYALGRLEGPSLLEELDNALNNRPFEEYYSPDNANFSDGVQIIPPAAIINQQVEVPLTHLKELIEEWIAFTKL
jgi:hypothetical protein